jgi:hypothetical protein
MDPQITAALIIAAAILVATALWIYFSPFQTCVRTGGTTLGVLPMATWSR